MSHKMYFLLRTDWPSRWIYLNRKVKETHKTGILTSLELSCFMYQCVTRLPFDKKTSSWFFVLLDLQPLRLTASPDDIILSLARYHQMCENEHNLKTVFKFHIHARVFPSAQISHWPCMYLYFSELIDSFHTDNNDLFPKITWFFTVSFTSFDRINSKRSHQIPTAKRNILFPRSFFIRLRVLTWNCFFPFYPRQLQL